MADSMKAIEFHIPTRFQDARCDRNEFFFRGSGAGDDRTPSLLNGGPPRAVVGSPRMRPRRYISLMCRYQSHAFFRPSRDCWCQGQVLQDRPQSELPQPLPRCSARCFPSLSEDHTSQDCGLEAGPSFFAGNPPLELFLGTTRPSTPRSGTASSTS